MRYYFWVIALLALSSCKYNASKLAVADSQIIEYELDSDQYAVVVVRADGMSEEEAKTLAMKKVAKKTRDHQKRYFTVEKEGEVQAMLSSGTAYDTPPPPRNMYYELIQSNDFGRDRFEDERMPQENLYPAYRIIFKCYADNPGGAVDACDLTPCT